MSSHAAAREARVLLGDFLVASTELGELAEFAGDPERWLVLASATVHALSDADPPTDLLDQLFATFAEHDLLARVRRPFEDSWPRIAWQRACVMRSGFEALRDLFERHAPALVPHADMSRIEQRMIQHGDTLFVPLPIPVGTPLHHWWWRAGAPAAERRMQMNERMRDLLPPRALYADNAPAKFRALVARGFVEQAGLLLFHDRIPPVTHGMRAAILEDGANIVRFADVFEPDPSRRLVDTVASAIACARHLAYELRRKHPPCRITVYLRPSTYNTIQFHQIRDDGEDAEQLLDDPTSAMLVLDSA